MRILRKPTKEKVLSLLRNCEFGEAKGILHNEEIFLWDSYYADHTAASKQLGIDPQEYCVKSIPFLISLCDNDKIFIDSPEIIGQLPFLKNVEVEFY